MPLYNDPSISQRLRIPQAPPMPPAVFKRVSLSTPYGAVRELSPEGLKADGSGLKNPVIATVLKIMQQTGHLDPSVDLTIRIEFLLNKATEEFEEIDNLDPEDLKNCSQFEIHYKQLSPKAREAIDRSIQNEENAFYAPYEKEEKTPPKAIEENFKKNLLIYKNNLIKREALREKKFEITDAEVKLQRLKDGKTFVGAAVGKSSIKEAFSEKTMGEFNQTIEEVISQIRTTYNAIISDRASNSEKKEEETKEGVFPQLQAKFFDNIGPLTRLETKFAKTILTGMSVRFSAESLLMAVLKTEQRIIEDARKADIKHEESIKKSKIKAQTERLETVKESEVLEDVGRTGEVGASVGPTTALSGSGVLSEGRGRAFSYPVG